MIFIYLLAVCICLLRGSEADSINSELVVKNVDRSIDVSTQLVKVVAKITLENTGRSPVKSFLFALEEPTAKNRLSFLGATGAGGEEGRRQLTVHPTAVPEHTGVPFWRIDLRQPIDGGKFGHIEVEAVFSHHLVPHPSEITQAEKQYVLYYGNVYFFTPYVSRKQQTTVTMTSTNVESYTKLKPVSQTDSTITYGPYENVPALSSYKMVVHYENNSPFLTVTSQERIIEVSHWGNVAVEESIDVRHTGATLKGPFSRYEYQRDQNGINSIKSFKTVLPASAADVYYRDEIGNISTSHLRILDDAVEVDLRPRFPLFGGWKTHYLIGYNLPSYEYLYNSGDSYILKMRFVDHIFDDMIVEKSTLKIILPEGARDIQFKAPFDVSRKANQLHFTYLDTTGRPVVVAEKVNLVENHIQEFELHYTYQKVLMLQEPLLVVLAFYLLFLLVIIYVRLDFAITKDEASECKMKVSGFCEQLQVHHDKRTTIYQRYEQAINNFKSNKDNSGFQATQKKLNSEHKNETQAIAELLTSLKQEAPEVADKVNELQKLDRLVKDQLSNQVTYAEKLLAGKMKKDQYVDFEQGIAKKKEDLLEKMDNILASL